VRIKIGDHQPDHVGFREMHVHQFLPLDSEVTFGAACCDVDMSPAA
jgi:hypothetical protein